MVRSARSSPVSQRRLRPPPSPADAIRRGRSARGGEQLRGRGGDWGPTPGRGGELGKERVGVPWRGRELGKGTEEGERSNAGVGRGREGSSA